MVSSNVSTTATVNIYRVGYYRGAGARKVWSDAPINVSKQAGCPRDAKTARIECDWTETFSFTVGSDWASGIYLVKVTRPEGFRRFASFVVRDGRPAEVLFQPAFTTAQAYNPWGGESLYRDDSGTMPGRRAYEVSFNRPFLDGDGSGNVLSMDSSVARLLEKNGYDVAYATNLDFSRSSNVLEGIGALVSAGHDEYWTAEERAQVDAALASGKTSLAYFGANGSFWRVRFANDARGRPLRTMICYKSDPHLDPIPGSTVRFRDRPNPQPESNLFGIMYDSVQAFLYPLVVGDPQHWLFQGAEVHRGEALPNLLGIEFDRLWPEVGIPEGVVTMMENPVLRDLGTASASQVVERNLPKGNMVFAAGSISWPAALNPQDVDAVDDRVARMTLNVIEKALSHRRPRRDLPAPGPVRPTPPAISPNWATSVQAFAGSPRTGGWEDGPGERAKFSGPLGLAITSAGKLIVADGNNHAIRLIDTDSGHTVTTIAGTGTIGSQDNVPGRQASFNAPTSVAVGSEGTIFVADSANHAIRQIRSNPPTWSVSTYAGRIGEPGYRDSANPLDARFNRPMSIGLDAIGNLYVSEIFTNRIRKIAAGSRQVTTYAGTGRSGWGDAVVGTNARFAYPSALAVAPNAQVYVLDAATQFLRRISPNANHAVDTIAGRPEGPNGYADGAGRNAAFRAQMGMAVSPAGEILLADSANFRIRKVVPGDSASSTHVYTFAGSGKVGTALGPGDAADIVLPAGIAVAGDGQVFVSDAFNHVIRRIVP
jgi:hypothetical protein